MKPGQPHNEKTLILPKVGEEYVHGERKARPHRWIPPTIWHAPLSPFCYKGNLLSPVPIRLQTSAPFRCSIAQTQYALPYYVCPSMGLIGQLHTATSSVGNNPLFQDAFVVAVEEARSSLNFTRVRTRGAPAGVHRLHSVAALHTYLAFAVLGDQGCLTVPMLNLLNGRTGFRAGPPPATRAPD
ncbi:hypothetical protein PGT21_003065 [Puccinia graminis f. sp. tritici]|uniref:Uncharacterized protein n=1 Tax=Puccinia graminis f. sp. tritici TaxID=56615 RepID=A0A5B0MAB6_PUCGR|nr:hypothetical protein PGT21_003065 [Puccinia graminis f. sp. tritici]